MFGRGQVVDNSQTSASAPCSGCSTSIFTHLQPGRDYRPITDEELARTTVYRIDIDDWSGKRKAVGENFPGAFRFGRGR